MKTAYIPAVLLLLLLSLPVQAQGNAYNRETICNEAIDNYQFGVYLNLYDSQLRFASEVPLLALEGVAREREIAFLIRDGVMGIASITKLAGISKLTSDAFETADAFEIALGVFDGGKAVAEALELVSYSETQDFMLEFGVDAYEALATGNPTNFIVNQGVGIIINAFATHRYYELARELRLYTAVSRILFPYYKSCKNLQYTAEKIGHPTGYPSSHSEFFEWALERIEDEHGYLAGYNVGKALALLNSFALDIPEVANSLIARLSTPSQTAPSITHLVPSAFVGSLSPQRITIHGTGFGPETTLRFFDGNVFYDGSPIYLNPTTLQYDINVGTAGAVWSVKVLNGTSDSNELPFSVDPAPDNSAPGAPRDFNVYPLVWAKQNAFSAVWNNPADQTGISKVWYKIGNPPTHDQDGISLDATRNRPLHFSLPNPPADYIHVWLEDGEGNVDHANRVSVLVQLDLDAPSLSITSPSTSNTVETNQTSISLSGTASDATSGISGLIWISTPLAESGFVTVDSEANWSVANIPLAPGNNTIGLLAFDRAKNIAVKVFDVNSSASGDMFVLNLSPSGNGAVNASPALTTYPEGSNVSIAAVPADGSTFSGWSGDASGSANPLTITMDSDKSITANFTQTPEQGSITVTLQPAAAVQAGAQWRYRDNEWLDSGETYVVNFPGPNSYANVEIHFREVNGWTAPASMEFVLPYGDSRTIEADPYIRPTISTNGQLTGSSTVDGDQFGKRLAMAGDHAIVSSAQGGRKTFVFERIGEGWIERKQLRSDYDDEGTVSFFGYSVDIDDPSTAWALVGAQGSNPTGAYGGDAHLFHNFGGSTGWQQVERLIPSDPEDSANFGRAVALAYPFAAVGAPFKTEGSNTQAGAVYVFQPVTSGNDWQQQQKLTSPEEGKYFGIKVALDGETLAVGLRRSSGSLGYEQVVYVYRYDGSEWKLEATLVSPHPEQDDSFGFNSDHPGTPISISGDVIVIGAWAADPDGVTSAGAVYVYRRIAATGKWVLEAELSASDKAQSDLFGGCVSIDGDVVLVGAEKRDDAGSSSGASYVFHRTGSTWQQTHKLLASDGSGDDRFGQSVAVSGTRALVGAPYDDVGGVQDHGSAWVFEHLQAPSVRLAAFALLQGAYANYSMMRTELVGLPDFPQSPPYSSTSSQNKVASAASFSASTVDWVVVKLLAGDPLNPPLSVVDAQAALLLSDGSIVAPDGAALSFGTGPGNYYVALYHRNHVPIMSAHPVDFSSGGGSFDFTTSQHQAYGSNPMKNHGDGSFSLLAGDGDGDGLVSASDYQNHWRLQNGSGMGYHSGDFNLDGFVSASDYQNYWRLNNGSAQSRVPD